MKRNVMRSIFLGLLLALLLSAGASGNGTERPEPVRAVVLYTEDADPGAVESALEEYAAILWRYGSLFSGAAVETEDLEALAELDGVAGVRPVRSYAPAGSGGRGEGLSSGSALALMGAEGLREKGWTGDGTVIAVLDSGLNTGHEVFSDASLVRSPAISREDTAAFAARGRTAGRYVSARIPFVYDYYSRDTDVSTREGHGTHVAALAAGYSGEGSAAFQGAAPGAQILGMKIFPDNAGGGTDDAVILRALEDAWNLGADVVNISVGTGAGFCRDGLLDGLYSQAFARMAEDGVIICCSAGNDGTNAVYKSWTQPLPTGGYTDYGAVTAPASYRGAVAVAASTPSGEMAGYSSWGPASELHLVPSLTAFGGPVLSAGASDEKVYYSDYGTSMASGSMSGLFAVLLQSLRERGVSDRAEAARLARGLLESTARVLTDERGVPLSPRKQGAGLVDLGAALSSNLLITDPLLELGDSAEGRFPLSLTLRNLSDRAITVSLDLRVLTDGHTGQSGAYYSTMTPEDITGRVTVTGSRSVTVPAGGEAEASLELTVGEALCRELAEGFPNGFYVEGYVTASGGGQHAAFLGYCGDWEAAPVLDTADFRDLQDAAYRLAGDGGNAPYSNPLENPAAYMGELDAELGVQLAYLPARGGSESRGGRLLGSNAHAPGLHDDRRNAIPGQGTDAMFGMERQLGLELCTLRDAAGVVMLVSNPDTGEVYAASAASWLKKSALDPFLGRIGPSARFLWSGTDASGAALPGGTRARVDVYVWLEAGDKLQEEFVRRVRSQSPESFRWLLEERCDEYRKWSFPVVIDSQSPVLTDAVREGERLVLTFRDDQYVSYAAVTDETGRVLAEKSFFPEEAGESCTLTVDRSAVRADTLYITVEDYASNTTGYALDPDDPASFRPTALHLLQDVEDGAWYRDTVDYAVSRGLMACDREGRFRPAASATRTEIVSALYRANGSPAPDLSPGELPFTDTGDLPDCLDALCWAYGQGLISGRSDGRFDGSAAVTRQELAVMLHRGVKDGSGGSLSAFSDAGSVAGWAKEAVSWAVGQGLLRGSGGRLSPGAAVTRAETAQILQRFLET